MEWTSGAYKESRTFAGKTVRNADIRHITSQPPLSSLSPVVLLSLGILHEWMKTQMILCHLRTSCRELEATSRLAVHNLDEERS